jgi:hypothetical protein
MKELKSLGLSKLVTNASSSGYHFLRWIWIQFPWIAMSTAHQVSSESIPARSVIAENSKTTTQENGFWSVKRVLPEDGPHVNSKGVQLAARLRCENKTDPSRISDTTAPQRNTIQLSHKISRLRAKHRLMKTDANIPFSSPSKRSVLHESRFPSVETIAKEKGDRIHKIFSGGIISSTERKWNAGTWTLSPSLFLSLFTHTHTFIPTL